MAKIHLNQRELDTISKIVAENNIKTAFTLISSAEDNGIGSLLDLEFDSELNGRYVTVRVPVTTVEDW